MEAAAAASVIKKVNGIGKANAFNEKHLKSI